jgi:acyl dehydratase
MTATPPAAPSAGWAGLTPGAAVPALVRTIELTDMVAYAGATWDWHRLHYDPEYLEAQGLPRPVVDGQMLGALLAETVQDWLGPAMTLRSLQFRLASLVFAGETVRCEGTVTSVTPDTVTVSLRVVVAGEPDRVAVTPASATAGRYR